MLYSTHVYVNGRKAMMVPTIAPSLEGVLGSLLEKVKAERIPARASLVIYQKGLLHPVYQVTLQAEVLDPYLALGEEPEGAVFTGPLTAKAMVEPVSVEPVVVPVVEAVEVVAVKKVRKPRKSRAKATKAIE